MRLTICRLRLAEQLSLFGTTEVRTHPRRTRSGVTTVKQHRRKVERAQPDQEPELEFEVDEELPPEAPPIPEPPAPREPLRHEEELRAHVEKLHKRMGQHTAAEKRLPEVIQAQFHADLAHEYVKASDILHRYVSGELVDGDPEVGELERLARKMSLRPWPNYIGKDEELYTAAQADRNVDEVWKLPEVRAFIDAGDGPAGQAERQRVIINAMDRLRSMVGISRYSNTPDHANRTPMFFHRWRTSEKWAGEDGTTYRGLPWHLEGQLRVEQVRAALAEVPSTDPERMLEVWHSLRDEEHSGDREDLQKALSRAGLYLKQGRGWRMESSPTGYEPNLGDVARGDMTLEDVYRIKAEDGRDRAHRYAKSNLEKVEALRALLEAVDGHAESFVTNASSRARILKRNPDLGVLKHSSHGDDMYLWIVPHQNVRTYIRHGAYGDLTETVEEARRKVAAYDEGLARLREQMNARQAVPLEDRVNAYDAFGIMSGDAPLYSKRGAPTALATFLHRLDSHYRSSKRLDL